MSAKKTVIAAAFCVSGAVVSFNGFLWQVSRRKWKKEMMDGHANMKAAPLVALPKGGDRLEEFRPFKLDGTLDNEGTVLVGPRPCPLLNNKNGTAEEQRGGFTAMTPFEVAGTKEIIMINRGWIPIDAAKSRLHMVKYLGDGFRPATITGILRKEEWISSWYNWDPIENHQPVHGEVCWFATRPYDMAIRYFKRRWGEAAVEERVKIHGLRRFFLEELEDHSGNDQVLCEGGRAYPVRRVHDDITRVAITPTVHAMYAAFWLSVSVGCMYALKITWAANYRSAVLQRLMQTKGGKSEEAIRKQQDASQAYYDEVRRAMEKGGSASKVTMSPTASPSSSSSSAAAAASAPGTKA